MMTLTDHQKKHLSCLKFLCSLKSFKHLIFFCFQIEGEVEKNSEVRATYKDLHAKVRSLTNINTLYLIKYCYFSEAHLPEAD